MNALRRPFFLAAAVCLLLAVLIEIGASLFGREQGRPPGWGVPSLAMLDGVLLYLVGMMGLALVVPERVQGRVQGLVTLLLSVALLTGVVALVFLALAALTFMLSLLLSVPFGTAVYLAIFGGFDRAAAGAALGLVLTLKLAFAAALVLAHQRFLQNRSLILLTLTSFLASVLVAWLHGLVPGFLVSITDVVAAIVVAVLALIWGVLLLLGGAISTVMSIRLRV